MQTRAATRHVAVRVTRVGLEPQETTVDGATARRIFEVPLLAVSVSPVSVGLHVRESWAVPVPGLSVKEMVRGLVFQMALGDEADARPTAA